MNKWISVTEYLPSDLGYDWVLAQIQEDNGYLWLPQTMEYRKAKDDWYSTTDNLGWLKSHNGAFKVIAWMPLPERYDNEAIHRNKDTKIISKSTLLLDTPNTCGDCPLCIHTKEEKKYIGYCNTSDEDYYCKALDRFMEYDKVDGGLDILGRPIDCPLQAESEG